MHYKPEGYHTITPYLIVDRGADAIDFYQRAFNAKELFRMPGADNKVMHAELEIGDSRFMLADEFPSMGALSPKTIGGAPTLLLLYTEDVDALTAQAIAAGAEEVDPIKDQFYGDRTGTIRDPFGYRWTLATHIEDVPDEEMQARMEQSACPSAD